MSSAPVVNIINKTGLDLVVSDNQDLDQSSMTRTLLCGTNASFTLPAMDGGGFGFSPSSQLYLTGINSINEKGYAMTSAVAIPGNNGSSLSGTTDIYVGVTTPGASKVNLKELNFKDKNILFLECTGTDGERRITRSNRARKDRYLYRSSGSTASGMMVSVNTTLTKDQIQVNRSNVLDGLYQMITDYFNSLMSNGDDDDSDNGTSTWVWVILIIIMIIVVILVVAGGVYFYKKRKGTM